MTRSITARFLLFAFSCPPSVWRGAAGAAVSAGIAFSAPLPPQDSSPAYFTHVAPPQTQESFPAQVKDLSGARERQDQELSCPLLA